MTEKQVVDKIKFWRENPNDFVWEVFFPELDPETEKKKPLEQQGGPNPDQELVLKSIPKNPFIAIKSGHGVGKTTLEAWITLWFLTCYPNCRVPITAPTEDQLTKILWPEISKWLNKSELRFLITWSKSLVYVNGEEQTAFAVYRTASKPEALQGFHEGNILFILEEASGIADEIWEPMEGALTTGNARAICLGNPTRPEGNFYKAFTDDVAFWKQFTFSCVNSRQVSKAYVERMRAKYGEESDVYRVRVLGEFPKQVTDAFIPLFLCERSLSLQVEHNPVLKMGVDVARFGDDKTVWLIRGGGQLKYARQRQTLDTMEIAGETIALAKQNQIAPENIFIDEIGIGAGVIDRLHELSFPVIPVNNASEPIDKETYVNRRAEIWGVVKQELLNKSLNLQIESDEFELTADLCGELASPKYKFTSKGQYQLESKDDMKRRGVQSPNIADALTLTYFYPTVVSDIIVSKNTRKYPE